MKTPTEIVLPEINLPFKLRDYQIEDINSLSLTESAGVFLGLGLGKTIISTLIGCYKIIEEKFASCMVLCPASLITQWAESLVELDLDTAVYRGTPKQRGSLDLKDKDFIVMSYQIFQKDYKLLKNIDCYYIIDEATLMCNSQNLIYKMLNGGLVTKKVKIPGRIKPKIEKIKYKKIHRGVALLTATPINKPTDAYGLINILTPGVYTNYAQFERIHVSEFDYFDQPKAYRGLENLQHNLLLHASQRLPSDHIDLPPLVFKLIKYDLDQAHKKLYDKLMDERFLELESGEVYDMLQVNALYHAAQRLILNPEEVEYKKLPVGIEIIDRLVESVSQFVLFNNYRATNSKLMGRYKVGGCFSMVTSKNKDKSIKDFQNGMSRGLVSHLRSGGTGLNLQHCQNVFFGELPVTGRDFRQGIGRLHRSGQKKTVVVTVLAANGTIQQTLMKRLIERDEIISQIIRNDRTMYEDLFGNVEQVMIKKTKREIMEELRPKKS